MCHFDEPERGEILKKHETTVTLKDFSVVTLLRNVPCCATSFF